MTNPSRPQTVTLEVAPFGEAPHDEPLFGIHRGPEALAPDHPPIPPTSHRLLRFVLQHPACTLPEACNGAGFPQNKLLRHLQPLVESGSLLEMESEGRTYLVPNVEGIQSFLPQLRALANPAIRQLYEWVTSLGESQPQDLIRVARRMRGWPRTTLQRRLAMLVEVGLAEHHREQRLWTRVRSIPPPGPVVAALKLVPAPSAEDESARSADPP